MIESVFFSVPFLNPFENFPFSTFFLALVFSIILYWLFSRRKTSQKKYFQKDENYIFPNINEHNFLEKIFLLMQKFAFNNYFPENSYSHSASDITKYCNNHLFLKLYKQIEDIIFDGKNISQQEKEKILNNTKTIISNTKK